MKYMGSKRQMLQNGLGELLDSTEGSFNRFVDLFSGGASVASHIAEKVNVPVVAIDIQEYAKVIAKAVIERTKPVSSHRLWGKWQQRTLECLMNNSLWHDSIALDSGKINTATWCKRARELCATTSSLGPVWNAYGGYYFSPSQALIFDALLSTCAKRDPYRSACLSSIIVAASQCVASPGHTAQPFKPSRTAAKYLREAWKRDPFKYTFKALENICERHALVKGKAKVGDALEEATNLNEDDLVFVDPPYSGVHYSRFYHVLETIAKGECGEVDGAGRYPPQSERPVSQFSRKSESLNALEILLSRLADTKCSVIFTFPDGQCSNGLSGQLVESIALKWFNIEKKIVKSKFSTLGGNNSHRVARQSADELILFLRTR